MKPDYKLRLFEQLEKFAGLSIGGLASFFSGVGGYSTPLRLPFRKPTMADSHAADLGVRKFNESRCWRPRRYNESRALKRKRRFDDEGRRVA